MPRPARDPTKLSGREHQVLVLLCCGATEELVGEMLGITYNTAHAHVVHIYKKLGSPNRSALTTVALIGGHIDLFELESAYERYAEFITGRCKARSSHRIGPKRWQESPKLVRTAPF